MAIQELATGALLRHWAVTGSAGDSSTRLRHLRLCTEQQRRTYEVHAVAHFVGNVRGGFTQPVEQIVAEHHAYLNGSGFPPKPEAAFTSDMTLIVMGDRSLRRIDDGVRRSLAPDLASIAPATGIRKDRKGKYESAADSLCSSKSWAFTPVYSYVALTTGERHCLRHQLPTNCTNPLSPSPTTLPENPISSCSSSTSPIREEAPHAGPFGVGNHSRRISTGLSLTSPIRVLPSSRRSTVLTTHIAQPACRPIRSGAPRWD